MIIRSLLLFTIVSLLGIAVFGQVAAAKLDHVGAYKMGDKDFILTFRLFDENRKLWLLGTRSVQLWDITTGKMISSEPHNIDGMNRSNFDSLSDDGNEIQLKVSPYANYFFGITKVSNLDNDSVQIYKALDRDPGPRYVSRLNAESLRKVNFEKYNPYKSYPKNDGAVTPSFGPATLSAGARLTGANFRLSLDGAKIALVADGKERMAAVEANTGKKLYEFKTEYKMRRVIGGASDESTDLSNPCQFTSHCPGDDYSGQQRLIDETRVTIHPDGRSFVTASNKSVKLFDAQQGEYPLTVKLLDPDDFSNGKFTTNRGAFDSAGWSKDGKIFFVVDYLKKSISLWAFERN